MADDKPQGDHGSPVGNLNNAISDFASAYVKKELQQLTRERDDALARIHVPKLRALLREVDKERQAFEQDKEKLVQNLRKKLEVLEVDAETIEATVAELDPVAPKYLSIIPSASTLTIRPPTPYMSPVRDNYFSTVLGADLLSGAPPLAAPNLEQGPSNPLRGHCLSPTNINVSPTAGSNLDLQIQSQILSDNSMTNQTPKRASADGDGSSSAKRRRVDGGRTPSRAQSDIFRKIAFPNLETGERIFRHSERGGLFVIRCNRPNCQSGFFTDPPLAYNRALKHFQSHGETGADGEELSNEYIFENFACEIEGSSMVSKYWIKEHLGPSPHTFFPGKSRSRTSQADKVDKVDKADSFIARQGQEDDKNYLPSNKPRDPVLADESDEELEVEKPRRTPRSVPRPDYAELVANKDPWNNSDADSDRAVPRSMKGSRTPITVARKSSRSGGSRSRSTSKTSTPGPSIARAKTTEPNRLAIHRNNGQDGPLLASRPNRLSSSHVRLIDGHILKIAYRAVNRAYGKKWP
ncbi:hypothetical protein F4677DRAFT_462517 [Hypoxylon crocopeplum]|nr:hypothetical protein F4677DRAFT_462517 [Hypoxylon crocopeplum]